jgi:hypothetical protein
VTIAEGQVVSLPPWFLIKTATHLSELTGLKTLWLCLEGDVSLDQSPTGLKTIDLMGFEGSDLSVFRGL